MVDRVRPLKMEDTATGGTEVDPFPAETEPHEDFLDCRGVAIQNDSSDDEDVRLSRDANGEMDFRDQLLADVLLTELLSFHRVPAGRERVIRADFDHVVEDMTVEDGGTLTVEDGGRLICL